MSARLVVPFLIGWKPGVLSEVRLAQGRYSQSARPCHGAATVTMSKQNLDTTLLIFAIRKDLYLRTIVGDHGGDATVSTLWSSNCIPG